jgi:hypothetical protein
MVEKIYLDMLTQDSVSIRKHQFTTIDGVEYPIGEPWRRAYVNSTQGREKVNTEVSEPYRSVVILMWGDSPTVVEQTSP